MFDDEILERIFANKELKDITINEQSIMIHVIETVLDEMEVEKNATLSES